MLKEKLREYQADEMIAVLGVFINVLSNYTINGSEEDSDRLKEILFAAQVILAKTPRQKTDNK